METIEDVAKKNKKGKFEIELSIVNDVVELKVLVVVPDKAEPELKAKNKKLFP